MLLIAGTLPEMRFWRGDVFIIFVHQKLFYTLTLNNRKDNWLHAAETFRSLLKILSMRRQRTALNLY